MRRNQAESLFQHGTIRTTVTKAKELRPFVERLITIARKNTLAARRQVVALLGDRDIYTFDEKTQDYVPEPHGKWTRNKTVVHKLFEEIAPRYVNRPGGYTRIIHIAEHRIGDAGKQCLLQLVEEKAVAGDAKAPAASSRRRQRAATRSEAAKTAGEGKESAEGKAAE